MMGAGPVGTGAGAVCCCGIMGGYAGIPIMAIARCCCICISGAVIGGAMGVIMGGCIAWGIVLYPMVCGGRFCCCMGYMGARVL